jgi:hypothetical protein
MRSYKAACEGGETFSNKTNLRPEKFLITVASDIRLTMTAIF